MNVEEKLNKLVKIGISIDDACRLIISKENKTITSDEMSIVYDYIFEGRSSRKPVAAVMPKSIPVSVQKLEDSPKKRDPIHSERASCFEVAKEIFDLSKKYEMRNETPTSESFKEYAERLKINAETLSLRFRSIPVLEQYFKLSKSQIEAGEKEYAEFMLAVKNAKEQGRKVRPNRSELVKIIQTFDLSGEEFRSHIRDIIQSQNDPF